MKILKDDSGYDFYLRNRINDEFVIKENPYGKLKCKDNRLCLDLGANIGAFAIKFSKKINKIICVEPHKGNVKVLKKNIKLNKINNIEIIKLACVGNSDFKRDLFLGKKNMGAHSFFVKEGRKKVSVKCININDLLEKYNPSILKIDTEGSEYEIIKAIKKWDNIKEIIFEFHFECLKDHPEDKKYFEVISILKENGFYVEYETGENLKHEWTCIVYANK